MVLLFMNLALPAECFRVRVECAKRPHDVIFLDAETTPPFAQGSSVRCLFGTEASVASTVVRWTNGTASIVGYWTQARRTMSDHDADCPAHLATHADAVGRNVWFAPVQECAKDFYELSLVDWTAP